ncbi:hypothetical protein AYO20_00631 [Fonsecaea nubica]|uniref:Protein kinase domain-containing protein n=1 Tax=Fonsecaea nubica TaxID=856822 RepID=A0A178DG68_9EURO|nr:hypothetical protein AYO20_00631 [Fonsecaea nubica]OAL40211.1 hypothetical protein AYO20_00631 [Fonsecaea nubica]
MDPFSIIGAIGFAFQVVEITIDAVDYWKRTNDVGDDIIMIVARLDMIRARIKSWSVDWGMREQRHLEHPKFREYGHLALHYLVIIQRRLVRFEDFETRYTGLFGAARTRSTGSVSRIAAVAAFEQTATNEGHVISGAELVTQLKKDVTALNHGNVLERWRWARRDKRGQMMVEQIDTLVKDLEDFFPPPRSDAAGAIVFNRGLSSSNIDSLQALPKLEEMQEGDDNPDMRDVSTLASLKIIAANLGQRAAKAKEQTLRWRSITTEDGKALSLEPCVGGRGIAKWKQTSRGDAETVLVEWKIVPMSLPLDQKTKLDARIYDLGKMLQAAGKPTKMLTLDCLGIAEKPVSDSSDAQYGLVFRVPPNHRPTSLYEHLVTPGTEPSCFSHRFALARALAKAVLYLHLASWLHKGIRSASVLFFTSLSDNVVDIAAPRLAGFEYSRLDEPSALTESTTDFGDHNLYRHPQHRGLPVSDDQETNNQPSKKRNSFNYKADLYSLGVVLLEVGLWLTAAKVVAKDKDANHSAGGDADQGDRKYGDEEEDEVRNVFVRQIPTLRRTMGPIYADVVERCLTGDFKPNDDEALATVSEAFYVNGVQPLDRCVV